CGFDDTLRPADKGDDRAVVIGVAAAVKQVDARHGSNGVYDAVHNLRPPTLGKIGDTLHKFLSHQNHHFMNKNQFQLTQTARRSSFWCRVLDLSSPLRETVKSSH